MWFGGDGLMMVLMVVVAGQWIRSGDLRSVSLGPWLDRIVFQATLGTQDDGSIHLDNDEAALAAYLRSAGCAARPEARPPGATMTAGVHPPTRDCAVSGYATPMRTVRPCRDHQRTVVE